METWKDFELAAAERFWDGLAIAIGRDYGTTGAVYIFGYVAEMVLKAAFFRASGFPAVNPVTGHLSQLSAAARVHRPERWPTGGRPSFHDLELLADALVHMRLRVGRPFPSVQEHAMRAAVTNLSAHWRVGLRYQPAALPEASANGAMASTEWLLANYHSLY